MNRGSVSEGIDHEAVYELLYQARWPELLDVVHRHRLDVAADELLSHAVSTFTKVFFDRLAEQDTGEHAQEIEKLFLLHTGGIYRLTDTHFDTVVERLVRLNGDNPEAAAAYAKHSPENEICAAALRRYGVQNRRHHSPTGMEVVVTAEDGAADYTTSLFKSRRELEFYLAVRDVFSAYFVYPNVALSTVIEFEAIRPLLGGEERSFFFRGVIDCVVFDQHDDYRPVYFFELDSELHDEDSRRRRDLYKDRIVAAAGRSLMRIRPKGATGKDDFARLLRDVVKR